MDVRVIASTNRDLEAAVRDGTFRRDLFFRLNVIPIVIPPLRERPEDVEPLARYFVEQMALRGLKADISHKDYLKWWDEELNKIGK